jgi:hypothetical protein
MPGTTPSVHPQEIKNDAGAEHIMNHKNKKPALA